MTLKMRIFRVIFTPDEYRDVLIDASDLIQDVGCYLFVIDADNDGTCLRDLAQQNPNYCFSSDFSRKKCRTLRDELRHVGAGGKPDEKQWIAFFLSSSYTPITLISAYIIS